MEDRAPGRLSQLSVSLWLRSWFQGPGLEPFIRLHTQGRVCLRILSLPLPLPLPLPYTHTQHAYTALSRKKVKRWIYGNGITGSKYVNILRLLIRIASFPIIPIYPHTKGVFKSQMHWSFDGREQYNCRIFIILIS